MRKIFIILFFCASTHIALAVDVSAVHFRSAGVDIATSQRYLLQWTFPNPNDTADIKNVLVLKLTTDEYGNTTLDSVAMLNNEATQYVDSINSCCEPIAYALRLFDKDPTKPAITTDLFRTMKLNSPSLDTCANAIKLRWSNYEKLDRFDYPHYNPIAEFFEEVRYHIYGYAGGSVFNPDSVVWLAAVGNATFYALPIIAEKKYHHLFIAAVYNNSSDTSYSNRVQIFTPLPIRPHYISIDSVLVSEQSTTLRFRIDNSTEYNRFWVEKSNDANVWPTQPIVEFNNKQQTSITNNAGGNNIAFYRISAVNDCGRVTTSSPVAATLGTAVYNSNNVNYISWNAIRYDNHDAGYTVYRTSPAELAETLGSTSQTSITDDLSLLPDTSIGATFCYAVEAIIPNKYYVRSVNACYAITPQVYMPNALQLSSSIVNATTGKSRNLFEPVSSYKFTYTMYIYSRTGKQIYSGQQAWNGKENNTGEFVTEGSYVYFVKIFFANGNRTELTGNVVVVY